MATINLLPWRDLRREELKKEFFVILGAVVGLAALLVFLVVMRFNNAIVGQNDRNGFLQTNINELNKQVEELRELKKKRTLLLERIKVIQSLQGDRPVIVRLFDETVRTIPDGVYYRNISRKKDVISLKGTAESNSRVSSLMRNFDSSNWFSGPNLKGVSANPGFGDQANNFSMTVSISKLKKNPNSEGK